MRSDEDEMERYYSGIIATLTAQRDRKSVV